MVNKLTIVNNFGLHDLHCKITHLAVTKRKMTMKMKNIKGERKVEKRLPLFSLSRSIGKGPKIKLNKLSSFFVFHRMFSLELSSYNLHYSRLVRISVV